MEKPFSWELRPKQTVPGVAEAGPAIFLGSPAARIKGEALSKAAGSKKMSLNRKLHDWLRTVQLASAISVIQPAGSG